MPLHTQIVRDGKPLELRWSGFHVASMVYAASIDSGQGPFLSDVKAEAERLMTEQGAIGISPRDAFELTDYSRLAATPMNDGPYEIKNSTLVFVDITDGEKLTIQPGDVLHAYRN